MAFWAGKLGGYKAHLAADWSKVTTLPEFGTAKN